MAEAVSLSEPPPGGGEPGGRAVTMSLAVLADRVISRAAPEQRELMALVTASWRPGGAGRRPRRGWTGGSVGFGADPHVVSHIIYPLLTGTLAHVLGAASVAGSWWSWRRLRPRRAAAADAVRVSISADQVTTIRAECMSHGMALGLPEPEAMLLADALAGVLWQALAGSAAQP